jgi:hypothetical protein
MPSVFFNNFDSYAEQDLVESLICESISIYGHGIYYCPRTLEKKDEILSEDTLSTYRSAYELDAYIRSYDAFEGDGTFLSKFNLEIRDQITFVFARRTFGSEIAIQLPEIQRPREGDLIYSSMMKRLFIIKFVNNTSIFYQMGSLQVWDVVCEVFEYSNERFFTGIWEIDQIEEQYSVSNVTDEDEYEDAMKNVFSTNKEFQEQGEGIVDLSQFDPFSGGSV